MASADAILRDEARPVHAQVSAGLTHAQRAFGLSPWETDLLALTVACADPRVHALVAALQPGHLREPTLAAALSIFELDGADAMYAQTLLTPDERLLRHGLLIAGSAGAPLDRTLTAPPFLIARLCGAHNPTFPLVEAAEPASEASRPAIEVLRSGGVVWITGPAGSGRDWTARRLIAAAGQPFLDLPPDLRPERRADVEREAIWWGAGLLVRAESVRAGLPLRELPFPIVVVGEHDDVPRVPPAEGRLQALVSTRRPTLDERRAQWASLLPQLGMPGELARHAHRGPRSPGAIRATLGRAVHEVRHGASPELAIERALADSRAPRFGALAVEVGTQVTSDQLVVPPNIRRELDLATAWLRRSQRLQDQAAAAPPYGPVCLFHGPPGTGKTLASRVLAAELGMPLFRVDLSQLVNKYIGETEKNLARVFDEASESQVVLLFDEADAVFGKRTSVKDAHDRYANIETAFLLQRIEAHEGPVLMTTNLLANLDEAFLRRIHVIAAFELPGPEQLARIWDLHLPADRASDVDIPGLAGRFSMSGGDVNNAATTAALLAWLEQRPVSMAHCVRAIHRELRKAGRMLNLSMFGPWAVHLEGVGGGR